MRSECFFGEFCPWCNCWVIFTGLAEEFFPSQEAKENKKYRAECNARIYEHKRESELQQFMGQYRKHPEQTAHAEAKIEQRVLLIMPNEAAISEPEPNPSAPSEQAITQPTEPASDAPPVQEASPEAQNVASEPDSVSPAPEAEEIPEATPTEPEEKPEAVETTISLPKETKEEKIARLRLMCADFDAHNRDIQTPEVARALNETLQQTGRWLSTIGYKNIRPTRPDGSQPHVWVKKPEAAASQAEDKRQPSQTSGNEAATTGTEAAESGTASGNEAENKRQHDGEID